MLGKLMKYEFKATARIFLPLYGALLAVSLLTRLLNGLRLETPEIISMILSAMLIAAAFVVTLILTIQRFYKNFMGSEGYLMHTLPVSVNKLIWSKLLVATVWNIVCVGVVFLSIAIMALDVGGFQSLFQPFTQLGTLPFNEAMLMLELILFILAAVMCGILLLYACMALSMLFNKHRVAISFAFFIAITTVIQVLAAIVIALKSSSIVGIVTQYNESGRLLNNPYGIFPNNEMLAVHAYMIIFLLIIAAFGAVFFATARYMLKNKLNLQ